MMPRWISLLRLVASATICILLASCACKAWTGRERITGPHGEVLCAKHHVPLVTVRAYLAAEDADVDMSVGYNRAALCFPNRIPYRVSLQGGGQIFIHPITITY